jgi:hypothetical protein
MGAIEWASELWEARKTDDLKELERFTDQAARHWASFKAGQEGQKVPLPVEEHHRRHIRYSMMALEVVERTDSVEVLSFKGGWIGGTGFPRSPWIGLVCMTASARLSELDRENVLRHLGEVRAQLSKEKSEEYRRDLQWLENRFELLLKSKGSS